MEGYHDKVGPNCPYCKHTFTQFIPWPDIFDFPKCKYEMWNKNTATCPVCHSFDRERLYKLYIERETDLLDKPQRILHVAPEKNLKAWIKGQLNISIVFGDLTPMDTETVKIDITEIPYSNDYFDVIICSHVLEHIMDDQKAMSELYRVLKPGGWSILQVPIALNFDRIIEDETITSSEARREHFGQDDHVRIYNKEGYLSRLQKAGFSVIPYNFAEKYGLEEAKQYGLSESDILYIGTK
ncbi:class I SAM-dependent methyltransferase [Evansella sp. AB-rgal1]|uniref:class I SAM-dependent methyltransferase n=1 Tax=Evansella sp. AB-rgal1 TaxID=3242696 RepID=UPI00359D3F82